jgi:hypothetical protein
VMSLSVVKMVDEVADWTSWRPEMGLMMRALSRAMRVESMSMPVWLLLSSNLDHVVVIYNGTRTSSCGHLRRRIEYTSAACP